MNKSLPWWNYGHVWMVIAGPAIVVVAGFVTLYLAISHPDPVQASYYTQGQVKGAVAELPPRSSFPLNWPVTMRRPACPKSWSSRRIDLQSR
ncbi:MAG: FixH family protein [Burkholderiaceae bacterium]|nr:MAG: FixH family protein [Burkholderiaceae bacterium]